MSFCIPFHRKELYALVLLRLIRGKGASREYTSRLQIKMEHKLESFPISPPHDTNR